MTELGKIGNAVNNVAMAIAYSAELIPGEDGKLKAELTPEGLDAFFRMNKRAFTPKARAAIKLAHNTLSRRQNRGAEGSLQVDVGDAYKTLIGFVQTHIAKKGDAFELSPAEAKRMGKTAQAIVNRYAMKSILKADFSEIARPQDFQVQAAAVRNWLLNDAVNLTRAGRHDTWLSQADLEQAIQIATDRGDISPAFAEAAEKTFFYAAQFIYRGRARPDWGPNRPRNTRSICQDMAREFQRGLNRLAGGRSATGRAIAAIPLDEAKSHA